jgi:hypothetical protein
MKTTNACIAFLMLFVIFGGLPAQHAIRTINFYWRNGWNSGKEMPVQLSSEGEGDSKRMMLTKEEEKVVLSVLSILAFATALIFFGICLLQNSLKW